MIKAKQLDFSLLDIIIEFVEKNNYHPFVPGKMKDAPSKVIFERDLDWLKQSNKIIADVNEPSHGVGMEIMYAFEHGIPILALINVKNRPLSRMVEGSPHVFTLDYNEKEDLIESMQEINLDKMIISFCKNCSEKTIHINGVCKKC